MKPKALQTLAILCLVLATWLVVSGTLGNGKSLTSALGFMKAQKPHLPTKLDRPISVPPTKEQM